MPSNSRPAWFLVLLGLYGFGALGMAVLVVAPSRATGGDPLPANPAVFRVLFAFAAFVCVLVLVGALRRWSGVGRGATGLHALIAGIALLFLASALKENEPLSKLFELVAKFAVHATLAWIWSRPAVRRAVAPSV